MKRLIVLLGLVGMLMLVASMSQARSEWAYFKENPLKVCTEVVETGSITCLIAEGYTGPRIYTLDSVDGDYYDDDYIVRSYTLDCCACHGPDAPGNHGGPQFPAWQCD